MKKKNKIFYRTFIIIVAVSIVFIAQISANTDTNETPQKQETGEKIQNGEKEQPSDTNNNPFSQIKFLPNISLILDFSYLRRNLDEEILETIEAPGFWEGASHTHSDGHSHAANNEESGFNLNYGEMVLFSTVDPYFDLFTAFHLSESGFEIEEAYIETRSLPGGFRLKLGKFLSSFGRLNAQHSHYWDFSEIPLVYRAFFGDHGLLEKGIQLNWVAPTNFYLGLGVESLQGENENSYGTETFSLIDATSEEPIEVGEVPLPNVWSFFGKTSFDIGDLTVLAGASYVTGKTRFNHFSDEDEPHGFAGKSNILGFDLTFKYSLNSYSYISMQMEYILRKLTGARYVVHEHESETDASEEVEEEHNHDAYDVNTSDLEKKQSGLYAQLVFRYNKLWRLGARWDRLDNNSIFLDGISVELPTALNRYSFMLDFNATEFSRIRFQYNINRFGYVESLLKNYNEFILQFNFAIGAHGAHPF